MNVLIITHHQLNINGGGAFASKAIANAFSGIADRVTLLYPAVGSEVSVPGLDASIEAVPVRYDKPKALKLLNLLAGRTSRYGKAAPPYILSGDYDTVVFDNSKTSFHLLGIAGKAGLKTITVHHNFEYEFAKGNSRGIFRPIDIFWSRRYESEACKGSELNLTLTDEDTALLSEAFTGGVTDRFATLGIFEPCLKQLPETGSIKRNGSPFTFAITGDLSIAQTVDSLVPWLKVYYPILKKAAPDSELVIAGRNPDRAIADICRKEGIELIASPASMDPIMKRADCYICPTDVGGGIKLRIMDGLRWGLPVITHKVSARGYGDFERAGHLLSYCDSDSFLQAVKRIISGEPDKRDIQTRYAEGFSFPNGTARLRGILCRHGFISSSK